MKKKYLLKVLKRNKGTIAKKALSMFMAFALILLSVPAMPVSAISSITTGTYPYNVAPAAASKAANGDIYYAFPVSGTVKSNAAGTATAGGTIDYNIYKWSASSNSWSLIKSINSLVNLNQTYDYYQGIDLCFDGNQNLNIAFNEAGTVKDGMYSKGIYYCSYNLVSNSLNGSIKAVETQTLAPTVSISDIHDYYSYVKVQTDASGNASIAYIKYSNSNSNDYHIKVQTGSSSNSVWTPKDIDLHKQIQAINYFLKDGSDNLNIVYTSNAAAGSDINVLSPPYTTPVKVLDGSSNYYGIYGATTDSLGKIYLLYCDAGSPGGFGTISNTGSGATWEAKPVNGADVIPTGDPLGALTIDSNGNKFILASTFDFETTYAATGYYLYGQAAGSNTWIKGYLNISELNNLKDYTSLYLYPVIPSYGKLMVKYFNTEQGLEASGYITGAVGDFIEFPGNITKVAGLTDSAPAGGDGSASDKAITWNITVPSSKASLTSSDIEVSAYGTCSIYSDSGYSTSTSSLPIISGGSTIAYIKTTSQNGATTRYYAVTINRAAPTYTLTSSQTGTYNFSDATEGYSPVSPYTVNLTSTGSGDITNLKVELEGADKDSFTLGALGTNTLNGSTNTTSFTIKPNNSLSAKTYTATVKITADNGVSLSFDVSFKVNAQLAPTASSVNITGTAQVGQSLTGHYTYNDANGDAEGTPTFKWYRSNTSGGAGKTLITGAVALTYALQAADQGKYISFEVTPVATTGTTTGTAVESSLTSVVVPAEAAPTASSVNITGTAQVGQSLTGNYTYNDVNGDLEGTSTFKWYRSNTSGGAGKTLITGAVAKTYTLQAADQGKYISFEVTPVAATGTTTGTAVESSLTSAIAPAEAAPTASSVSITGTAQVGQSLTGNYTYNDVNGDLEGTSTFKWYRSNTSGGAGKTLITGAVASTYTLQVADIGKYISFEVTPVAATGTTTGTAVGSSLTSIVVPAEAAPTVSSVNITGTAQVGQSLTGNYTYNDANGDLEGISTFKWYRSNTSGGTGKTLITGAVASIYTLQAADEGKYISFEVTPVATTGIITGTAIESSLTSVVVPAEAAPTASSVNITGTAQVGQSLTGHYTYNDVNGDLEGTSTFKWYRSNTSGGVGKTLITGAVAKTYTLQAADEGKYISFEVTPIAATGTTTGTAVESYLTSVIVPAEAAPTASSVNITGTAEVGQSLTGHYIYNDVNGDAEGTSTFKWYRSNTTGGAGKTLIAGAVASTYTLQGSDIGKYISFEVIPVAATGIITGTAVENLLTEQVILVEAAPTASSVSITGTAQVGQSLTGQYTYNDANGDLEGTSTFKWYRSNTSGGTGKTLITGAVASIYTLQAADEGKYISFEVTPVATTGIITGTASESSLTSVVVPAEAAPTASSVSITGTAQVGQSLTGHYTYNDVNGDLEGTSTFKWYRSDTSGGVGKTLITGAVAKTYTLQAADEGKYISFEVTPIAPTGTTTGTAVESSLTSVIVPAEAAPTASSVNITGTAQVGQSLTGNYTYNDVNGDLEGTSTFKWYRSNTAGGAGKTLITGAVASTYTLQGSDIGKYISFEVTPVATIGTTMGVPVESFLTSIVVAQPDNGVPTAVTGSVVDPQTGKEVKGIEAQVTTASDGTKSVSVKSNEAIVFQKPDGANSTFTDISKISFSVPETTGAGTNTASVIIKEDGTIQVSGLPNGSETKFQVTIDLGNGQKLVVGSIDVKISTNGNVNLISTLIDPYGIITDVSTGDIISGAQVTLYYANTERNIKNGKTPDTLVNLPVLEGFKPNNNINPQNSDATGAYGFMVFPTSDYYIVAKKAGYKDFKSENIAVESEIVKYDFKMEQQKLAAPVTATLPKTGSDIDLTVLIALGVLLIGTGGILLLKKRDHLGKK